MAEEATENSADLLVPFRFRVSFSQPSAASPNTGQQAAAASGSVSGSAAGSASNTGQVASRAHFSEITGLEMNTTPKSLKEGGRNWGEVQLSAPVSFPNLVLKRGITRETDLWAWYRFIYQQGRYAQRADCTIEVKELARTSDGKDRIRMKWTARNCLPVKFKGSDLSGTASSVAIEELHLAHEGLELEWVDQAAADNSAAGDNNGA